MAQRKPIRWSKVALVASLAVNLLVIGLVAGAWFNGPSRGAERLSGAPSWASGPIGRALSKDDRRALGKAFRGSTEYRGQLRAQRGEMRDIGRQIAEAVRADPFNPGTVETLFAKQVSLAGSQMKIGHAVLLARISAMTDEERAGFADRLEEAVTRGRPRKNR